MLLILKFVKNVKSHIDFYIFNKF